MSPAGMSPSYQHPYNEEEIRLDNQPDLFLS